jgi:hypothetical protein
VKYRRTAGKKDEELVEEEKWSERSESVAVGHRGESEETVERWHVGRAWRGNDWIVSLSPSTGVIIADRFPRIKMSV